MDGGRHGEHATEADTPERCDPHGMVTEVTRTTAFTLFQHSRCSHLTKIRKQLASLDQAYGEARSHLTKIRKQLASLDQAYDEALAADAAGGLNKLKSLEAARDLVVDEIDNLERPSPESQRRDRCNPFWTRFKHSLCGEDHHNLWSTQILT